MTEPMTEPMNEQSAEAGRSPRRLLLVGLAVVLALVGVVLVAVALTRTPTAPPGAAPDTAAISGEAADRPAPAGSPAPAAPSSAVPPPAAPALSSQPSSTARPMGLSVPAIDVDGPVREVGLNPDRTMEVPQPGPFYDDAAWYRDSPVPGRLGPSVIIGHVDSAETGPSIFAELGTLVPGDRAEVTLDDGSTQAFVVEDVRTFAKDEFPTMEVYGDTSGPELRLITCSGPFDSAARSYLDNTVVFARAA